MRLGDAEREALAALLGRHYVAGRLDADELGRRLELIHAAATQEEAGPALADLPPLAASGAPRRRRWGRRHGEASSPDPTWFPTPERFVDPTTGRVMRVWVEPGGGRRHYVPEA